MKCTVCARMMWGMPSAYEAHVLICPHCGTVVKNKLTTFKGTPRNEEERREVLELIELNLAAETSDRVRARDELSQKICKLKLVGQDG